MAVNETTMQPRLLTVKKFVEEGHYPNHGGIRSILFNSRQNGFDKCVRRIGRRILIDVDAYYSWIEETNK